MDAVLLLSAPLGLCLSVVLGRRPQVVTRVCAILIGCVNLSSTWPCRCRSSHWICSGTWTTATRLLAKAGRTINIFKGSGESNVGRRLQRRQLHRSSLVNVGHLHLHGLPCPHGRSRQLPRPLSSYMLSSARAVRGAVPISPIASLEVGRLYERQHPASNGEQGGICAAQAPRYTSAPSGSTAV